MMEDFTSMLKSKEEGLKEKVRRLCKILECEYGRKHPPKIKNRKTFK
jgi:hypothetical protein